MNASLLEHVALLKDPRIDRHKRHALLDIVVLTICAAVSGAEGWQDIAAFGHEKLRWLRRFIPLKNGVPSHDCIAYVMSRLSPKSFQKCFMDWTREVMEHTQGEVIAVDGKTARRSHDRRQGKNPLHMVSAWATANRLVLGQEQTEEKSNEITAIPKLLAMLELRGCIVTTDAMGCQRAIAEQIIDQDGDYVLGLKGNQESLHDAVRDYFTTAQAAEFAAVPHAYTEQVDKDHGRLEIRRYWITEDLGTLPRAELWKGLRSIGLVEREYWEGSEHCLEQRHFICSIAANAQAFAQAVRGHWAVENSLHWRLDVVFREDESRIRKGHAPANMTAIRHLCLNLLRQEPSKLSIKKKRLKAAWNDRFRYKVLFGQ